MLTEKMPKNAKKVKNVKKEENQLISAVRRPVESSGYGNQILRYQDLPMGRLMVENPLPFTIPVA
jgi:hypothetical protein